MVVIESTYGEVFDSMYVIGNQSTCTFFLQNSLFFIISFSCFVFYFKVAVYRSHMKHVSFT